MLKKLNENFKGLAKAVNMSDMEELARISNKKSKNLKALELMSSRKRDHDQEHRLQIQKRSRMKQFKEDYRKYGLLETLKIRLMNFCKTAQYNRSSRKMMEEMGRQCLIRRI